MNFEIITDSSANLPQAFIEENNIHVLSLSYFIEEEEFSSYIPGEKNDLSYFYKKMREKAHIRTSLVNVDKASIKVEELLKQGKDILYIGFSSALSGTFQAVSLVCKDMREKYPDAKIICVDTLSALLAEGLLVLNACAMRKEGRSIEETGKWVEDNRMKACHWVAADDLFYLKRGGRISTTAAVFGSALSVKPIIRVEEDGTLQVVDKTRGRKKALDELIRHMRETVECPEQQIMGIAHADCEKDALYLKEKMEEFNPKGIMIESMEPVVASHTGPSCIAIFFFGSKR